MESKSILIQQAKFNPNIKKYIFFIGTFILTASIVGIPLLFIWLIGLGQYISKNYYKNLSCQLSDSSLEFKKGILFKVETTIPLENIQDLSFNENPVSKYFGLNILKIETAGQSNADGSDMKLIGIINSKEFKQRVLSQRELLQSGKQVNSTSSDSDRNQIVNILTEIKEILVVIKNK